MSREAMQQALEALEQYVSKELTFGQRYTNEGQGLLDSITALRAALAEPPCKTGASCTNKCQRCAEPEQEPDDLTIAYMSGVYDGKKQRKPLTDEALKPLIQKAMMYYGHNPDHWTLTAGAGFCIFARAIERAHGIKEQEHE
jgi:hypothetical protein